MTPTYGACGVSQGKMCRVSHADITSEHYLCKHGGVMDVDSGTVLWPRFRVSNDEVIIGNNHMQGAAGRMT